MLLVANNRLPVSSGWLALASIGLLVALAGCVAGDNKKKESMLTQGSAALFMRERLGHFSRFGSLSDLRKLYPMYFESVTVPKLASLKDLDVQDWRRFRPTGDMCIDALTMLQQVRNYQLNKPYELVLVDACLDWLYGPAEKTDTPLDVDEFSDVKKLQFEKFKNDQRLRDMYETTAFKDKNKLPAELVAKVYKYLERMLKIHLENHRLGCHGKWLAAYNDFLDEVYLEDCDDETNCNYYNHEGAGDDPYLKMLADSTIEASKTCYGVMQKQMHELMVDEFAHSVSPVSMLKRIRKNAVRSQQEKEKWTSEMRSVLQLAEGVDQNTCVNLGDVAVQLEKIKQNDQPTIKRFLEAVGKYADTNALSKADEAAAEYDSTGRQRYGLAMGKLCRPFIDYENFLETLGGIDADDDHDTRAPFDFYHIVYSLVRLTNHEQIIGISKEDFEEDVLENKWAAVYLSTLVCQIISTSWGILDNTLNDDHFLVYLRQDSQVMVADWPLERLSEQLPLMYPRSGSSSSASKSKSAAAAAANRRFFGAKSKSKVDQDQDQDDHEDDHHSSHSRQQQASGPANKRRPNEPKPVPKTPKPGEKLLSLKYMQMHYKLLNCFPDNMYDIYFEVYPVLLEPPYSTEEQKQYFQEHHAMGDKLKPCELSKHARRSYLEKNGVDTD